MHAQHYRFNDCQIRHICKGSRNGDGMSSEAIAYLPQAGHEKAAEPPIETEGQSDIAKRGSVPLIADSEFSDEILMDQIRHGVKEALSLIFRRYSRVVRNVAYRILRNEAEADDLVQDVFLFIFRKSALFDGSRGPARSWIIHVTYHRAFDRRRYLNTRRFYSDQGIETAALDIADRRSETLLYEWSMEGVWGKALAAKLRNLLSPDQLATIELHFFEGCTLEEVAERMGQSLGNIRHHYYRGLEKLRKPAFAGKLRLK